ncbi:sensor histidine kinase [Cellulomonas sp. NS3]|uniref:sensor histidine kinase n=1 Tax=Cellulomonas sp. NS3 TaxID=2973977 RepID=UPI002162AFFE|nr:sensor histidine kinase [Cellulomonas sp. NS3]
MGWWERAIRWEDTHRLAVDAAGTALLALVAVPVTALVGTVYEAGYQSAGVPLIALALIAPLAWRRAQPVASVATVYTIALIHLTGGYGPLLPADVAVLLALYSVTVHGPRWAHRVAVLGAIVGSLVLGVTLGWAYDPFAGAFAWMFGSAISLAVWAFGLVRRSRREAMDALVDRARRLEIERDQQHQIATAAERSRIAREMHDIVAHSLSVMIAQADGGRYAAGADPAAAARSLGTIAETGRAALGDMRRLLGVLRTDEAAQPGGPAPAVSGISTGPGGAGGAPYTPQPAEQDLEALVEQVRASGLRVSLVRMGTARRLPPGAGLTAYRICQEALTNILKHAGPDPTVTVVVQWLDASLVLEIGDDGRGAAAESDGLGQGLLGMRERAAMFGGSVTAGPRPGGGFRVRAQIPLPPVGGDRAPVPGASPAPARPGAAVQAPVATPAPASPPAPAPSPAAAPPPTAPQGAPDMTTRKPL